MFKLAVLQVTYDKITDVKIGMELIKYVWPAERALASVDIYHAYNGDPRLYKEKYLESHLIRRTNKGHFEGAADLIDAGMQAILSSEKTYDYLLVMSGDVWLTKPDRLAAILTTMKRKKYVFAGTLWPNFWFVPTHLASEFFIITPTLARHVFPLDLPVFFSNRHKDNVLYNLAKPVPFVTVPKVELTLTHKVRLALGLKPLHPKWRKHVYLLPGRRVYHGKNRYYSKGLGYLSHHNLTTKCRLALQNPAVAGRLHRCPVLLRTTKG